MASDRQKASFVGIVSHELRSPLHGILASVEFLSDSELTGFQESIVNTIEACGRTLLDTINHMLDFSKINCFEKSWQASNRHKDKSKDRVRTTHPEPLGGSVLANRAPPMLQLYGVTDISVILEEVVEGITAGCTYNHHIDLTDTSKRARGRSPRRRGATDESVQASSDGGAVEVILDIGPGDWVFMTQPGAVHRIIMNTFGNAVKYTTHGSVKVRLELNDQDIVLKITDTGKGISSRFLNSRLFMPFAQENALAPGTGLGLRICKSIITMLGGNVDVQSRVGSGTTVKVSLPLVRPIDGSPSAADTPRTTRSSIFSAPDRTIPDIRLNATKCHVALYQACEAEQHLSSRELYSVLEKYIKVWYGLQLVEVKSELANIVLLDEGNLHSFAEEHYAMLDKFALIVLCNNMSRRSLAVCSEGLPMTKAKVVEYLSKPVGPHKLAKVVRACLKKLGGADFGTFAPTPGSFEVEPGVDIANRLNDLTLGRSGEENQIMVQANEVFSASQTSQHAQDAISTPCSAEARKFHDESAFPFPKDSNSAPVSRRPSRSILLQQHMRSSEASEEPTPIPRKDPKPIDPRMLIVDDNAITLKLLHTFLKKRKCSNVTSAENGAMAVDLFKAAPAGRPYEIVFMDVSMPVMNGFEATRAIRDFEDKTNATHSAVIIALTGLASGRDQAEGFASGCDIYLTKPVSFKEVGRLLDNWAANRSRWGSTSVEVDGIE